MNEYAKRVLRQQVLEHRAALRVALQEQRETETTLSWKKSEVKKIAERIADLQKAAGDPVDIDPQNPEVTTERMRSDLRRLQGSEFHLSSTPAMWQYNGWWLNADTWVLTSPTGRTLTDFSPEEVSFLRSRMRSDDAVTTTDTESQ